jgi:putative flippase GtrA
MNPILLRRAIRFTSTGFLVTAEHVLIATIFIEYLMAKPPVANGIAFLLATLTSYLINTIWSFSGQLHRKSLVRFIAVSIIGFLLAILVSAIVHIIGFHYLYGIITVALLVPPMTFILHNYWTYKC